MPEEHHREHSARNWYGVGEDRRNRSRDSDEREGKTETSEDERDAQGPGLVGITLESCNGERPKNCWLAREELPRR